MGVDCLIDLPAYTRIEDVAQIMGRLFGLDAQKVSLKNPKEPDAFYTTVPGITFSPGTSVGSRVIIFEGVKVGGQERRAVTFYYETHNDGRRHMCPEASPFWQLMARRLVIILGGSVQYSDASDDGLDIDVPHNLELAGRDNDSFGRMQQVILDIVPMTQDEINDFWQQEAFAPIPVRGAMQPQVDNQTPNFGLDR